MPSGDSGGQAVWGGPGKGCGAAAVCRGTETTIVNYLDPIVVAQGSSQSRLFGKQLLQMHLKFRRHGRSRRRLVLARWKRIHPCFSLVLLDTRLGAVHIQWHEDRLEVSNPGGFPEGVTLKNLLVTPPRPRNLLLADAFKRAGLVERTARGIDTIFEEQLRNGRPAPVYDRSTATDVVVVLPGGAANLEFVRCVAEESQSDRELKLDALLVLNCLWQERRCTNTEVAELIQKSETEARTVLHTLVERGLLKGRGEGKGRSYHLSAAVYRRLGAKSAYVLQRGFEPLQQEHTHRPARRVRAVQDQSQSIQVADFQALEERKNRPARPQTRFIL